MKKVLKILEIIILVILSIILILSVVFIGKSYIDKDNVPSLFGRVPLVVLSGSMESEISTGDLIIVHKEDTSKLKEGDIIAFYTDNSRKSIITHRIVEITNKDNQKQFITKGDNNVGRDVSPTNESLVVGKYNNKRFKGLGNTVVFLQTPTGMCIVISLPLGMLIIAQFVQNRKNKKELEELRKQKKEEQEETKEKEEKEPKEEK